MSLRLPACLPASLQEQQRQAALQAEETALQEQRDSLQAEDVDASGSVPAITKEELWKQAPPILEAFYRTVNGRVGDEKVKNLTKFANQHRLSSSSIVFVNGRFTQAITDGIAAGSMSPNSCQIQSFSKGLNFISTMNDCVLRHRDKFRLTTFNANEPETSMTATFIIATAHAGKLLGTYVIMLHFWIPDSKEWVRLTVSSFTNIVNKRRQDGQSTTISRMDDSMPGVNPAKELLMSYMIQPDTNLIQESNVFCLKKSIKPTPTRQASPSHYNDSSSKARASRQRNNAAKIEKEKAKQDVADSKEKLRLTLDKSRKETMAHAKILLQQQLQADEKSAKQKPSKRKKSSTTVLVVESSSEDEEHSDDDRIIQQPQRLQKNKNALCRTQHRLLAQQQHLPQTLPQLPPKPPQHLPQTLSQLPPQPPQHLQQTLPQLLPQPPQHLPQEQHLQQTLPQLPPQQQLWPQEQHLQETLPQLPPQQQLWPQQQILAPQEIILRQEQPPQNFMLHQQFMPQQQEMLPPQNQMYQQLAMLQQQNWQLQQQVPLSNKRKRKSSIKKDRVLNFFDTQAKDIEIVNLQRMNNDLKRSELSRILIEDDEEEED